MKRISFLLLCLLYMTSPVSAQYDFEWIGDAAGGDGFNWSDPLNWDSEFYPGEIPTFGTVNIPQFSFVAVQSIGIFDYIYLDELNLEPGAGLYLGRSMTVYDLDLNGNNSITATTRAVGDETTESITVENVAYFNNGVSIAIQTIFGFVPQNLDAFNVIRTDGGALNCGGLSSTSQLSDAIADYAFGVQCLPSPQRVTVSVIGISYGPDTIEWDSPDGFWDDGSNWVGGSVPGPNHYAVINDPTNCPTVTNRFGATYRSLRVGACNSILVDANMTSGTNELTSINRDGSMVWLSGTKTGAGLIYSIGNITMDSPQDKIIAEGRLFTESTVDINQGRLLVQNSFMSIFGFHGGEVNINGDNIRILQTTGTTELSNFFGDLTKTTGTGISNIQTSIYNDVNGTIRVQLGVLKFLNESTTFSDETEIIGPGAIDLGSDDLSFPDGFVFEGTLAPGENQGGSDPLTLHDFGTSELSARPEVIFIMSEGKLVQSPIVQTRYIQQNERKLNNGNASPQALSALATVGTMTVTGNLTTGSASTLDVDIDGPTAGTEHDQIIVTGTASISGNITANLSVVPTQTSSYLILSASSLSCNNLPSTITSTVGATDVELDVVCSTTELRLNGQNPLPVELVSFTGHTLGNQVELSWSTSSETNNAGFEVQQLVEDSWFGKGFVEGAGNSLLSLNYEFSIGDLEPGPQVFRLKQVDYDGGSELSNQLEIDVLPEKLRTVSIYPNPVIDHVKLSIFSRLTEDYEIEIYDSLGRRAATNFHSRIEAGQRKIDRLNLTDLSPGNYFIRIVAGASVLTKKISLTN